MSKRRTMNVLNTKSIDKTIQALKDVRYEISKVPYDIENILDEAVQYCKSLSGDMKADTYWRKTPDGYQIVQEGEAVLYVEFGTGLVGHENMHESLEALADADWKYGVGATQHATANGKFGWFYPEDESRKSWKFTEGQPAHMQMYRTSLWLQERLGAKVKMRIKKGVAKW